MLNKICSFRLNGNALKVIAVITMAIDHIGAILIEHSILYFHGMLELETLLSIDSVRLWYYTDNILRTIGRLSFPLFCFLLVEGFLHTHDSKRYLKRLIAFAVISEVPFDLALVNQWFYPEYQNVYFTLAIGLITLMGLKKFEKRFIPQILIIISGCTFAFLLKTDYDIIGILLISLLYLFHERKAWKIFLSSIVMFYVSKSSYGISTLTLIPICLYNGEKGKMNFKYFFYWFYPVHLLLLFLIRYFIIGVGFY